MSHASARRQAPQHEFALSQAVVHAVNDVSFSLAAGRGARRRGRIRLRQERDARVSLMRLIKTPGRICAGEVILHDEKARPDLLKLTNTELGAIRGNRFRWFPKTR